MNAGAAVDAGRLWRWLAAVTCASAALACLPGWASLLAWQLFPLALIGCLASALWAIGAALASREDARRPATAQLALAILTAALCALAVGLAERSVARAQARGDALLVLLEAHRARHGRYPATLDQLPLTAHERALLIELDDLCGVAPMAYGGQPGQVRLWFFTPGPLGFDRWQLNGGKPGRWRHIID